VGELEPTSLIEVYAYEFTGLKRVMRNIDGAVRLMDATDESGQH